jgi:hypothetical protein
MSLGWALTPQPHLRKTPSGGRMMARRMSMQVAVLSDIFALFYHSAPYRRRLTSYSADDELMPGGFFAMSSLARLLIKAIELASSPPPRVEMPRARGRRWREPGSLPACAWLFGSNIRRACSRTTLCFSFSFSASTLARFVRQSYFSLYIYLSIYLFPCFSNA